MPFTPSPLMGEGWGEGEEKHIVPPSLSLRDIPYSLIDRKRCGTSSPPARGGEFFGGLFWVI